LAVVGLIGTRTRGFAVAAPVMGAMWATAVVMVVGWRYRAPMIPFLCLYAGRGTVVLWRSSRTGLEHVPVLATVVILVGALSISTSVPDRNGTAEEWAFTGERLIARGRVKEAETYLNRALSIDPSDGVALAAAGTAWYQQRNYEAARSAAQRAVEANPYNPRAHRILAAVALGRSEIEVAIGHLSAIVLTRPTLAALALNEGLAELDRESFQLAMDRLRQSADTIDPSQPELAKIIRTAMVRLSR
jgi:predicted Zn-dependent protease